MHNEGIQPGSHRLSAYPPNHRDEDPRLTPKDRLWVVVVKQKRLVQLYSRRWRGATAAATAHCRLLF